MILTLVSINANEGELYAAAESAGVNYALVADHRGTLGRHAIGHIARRVASAACVPGVNPHWFGHTLATQSTVSRIAFDASFGSSCEHGLPRPREVEGGAAVAARSAARPGFPGRSPARRRPGGLTGGRSRRPGRPGCRSQPMQTSGLRRHGLWRDVLGVPISAALGHHHVRHSICHAASCSGSGRVRFACLGS